MQNRAKDPSSLRHELGQLLNELSSLTRTFSARSPMWPGNVYVLRRRCGKANCRCAQGELHESTVLSDRSGDSPRIIPLKGKEIEKFRRMTLHYQRFRKARARITKITQRILAIVDALGEIRVKEGLKKKKR